MSAISSLSLTSSKCKIVALAGDLIRSWVDARFFSLIEICAPVGHCRHIDVEMVFKPHAPLKQLKSACLAASSMTIGIPMLSSVSNSVIGLHLSVVLLFVFSILYLALCLYSLFLMWNVRKTKTDYLWYIYHTLLSCDTVWWFWTIFMLFDNWFISSQDWCRNHA